METTTTPKFAPMPKPTARLTDPVSPKPMQAKPMPEAERLAPQAHPLLTLNTRQLGQALNEMIKKTLAYAESLPAPRANLSPADLLELVLDDLRKKYACKRISGAEIRKTLDSVCAAKANDVGHLLYPKHILRLGLTNFFVFRQNELRPLEYQGLIPDSSGVLPDAPAPF
jgi:hypothetical protein